MIERSGKGNYNHLILLDLKMRIVFAALSVFMTFASAVHLELQEETRIETLLSQIESCTLEHQLDEEILA